ncbi:glycosyltransferase family 4 protein [Pedobacter sp. N23S346]|uniref:glycosyltransferase family 4 protein n=1 Tax=Pedobacter sp. N23S346 TaxID=3402750 RepID=UPI003ACF30C6
MKNVLILYKSMPQYRLEFFSLLHKKLAEKSIHLHLIYGNVDSQGKNDSREIDFGQFRPNKFFNLGKKAFIWQPCLAEIETADLVIVEQANKLLINYVLLYRRLVSGKKFAFWGHGSNMQANEGSLLNRFKRIYSNYTDHWFAYTGNIKHKLIGNHYPSDKVTVVENAIDTRELINDINSITQAEVAELRLALNITEDEKVLIYCGALYKEKRLDFLIETCDRLYAMGYQFKLMILGGGPLREYVNEEALKRPWMLMVGPKFGRDKALYFKISTLFLMPGAIGLAILDAFAFSTPMVTTDYEFHGPEFEYLVNEYNGIVSKNNLTDYLKAIVELLNKPKRIHQLKVNCEASAKKYTVENMVDNFVTGITKTLQV